MSEEYDYPTSDYPRFGDALDPEPLRKNAQFIQNHAARHEGDSDPLDVSRLEGQGHNNGLNADQLDGSHLSDVLAQVSSLIQETLESGTGETTTETAEGNFSETAQTVDKTTSAKMEIEINQGDNNYTDPINPNFLDEPAGPNTVFKSHERYEVTYHIPLPKFFTSVSNVSIRKENPDAPDGEKYEGFFLPGSTGTDNDGNPIERPSVESVDLDNQIIVVTITLPSDITYEDTNGNTVQSISSGSFIDDPDAFSWAVEVTGEVPEIQGHASRHEGGLDPINVSELGGQGHGEDFNADRLDGKHAADLARYAPTSPSRVSIDALSSRNHDLFINVWMDNSFGAMILGIVSPMSSIPGTLRVDFEPGQVFFDEAEIIETRAMGQQLRDDGSSTVRANNRPNFETTSGNIAGMFSFSETPPYDENIILNAEITGASTVVNTAVHVGSLFRAGSFSSADPKQNYSFSLYTKFSESSEFSTGG